MHHALETSLPSTNQIRRAKTAPKLNQATSIVLVWPADLFAESNNLAMWELPKPSAQYASSVLKSGHSRNTPSYASAKPKYIVVTHFDMRYLRPHSGKCAVGDDRVALQWNIPSIGRNVMRPILVAAAVALTVGVI